MDTTGYLIRLQIDAQRDRDRERGRKRIELPWLASHTVVMDFRENELGATFEVKMFKRDTLW